MSTDGKSALIKKALADNPAMFGDPFGGKRSIYKGLINSIGKNGLMRRSESYKNAVMAMESVDKEMRVAFNNQKKFIDKAYWAKFRMKLGNFAVAVNNFMNTQYLMGLVSINTETDEAIKKLLQGISYELYKEDKPEVLGMLDVDNLRQIIETTASKMGEAGQGITSAVPETQNWVQAAKKIQEERAKAQKAQEEKTKPAPNVTALDEYNELVKTALVDRWIAGRHYERLSGGRTIKADMDKIYNAMTSMYESNRTALDDLNSLANMGDPEEYFKALKKNAASSLNRMANIIVMWRKHFEGMAQKYESEELGHVRTETPPAQEATVPAATVEATPMVFDQEEYDRNKELYYDAVKTYEAIARDTATADETRLNEVYEEFNALFEYFTSIIELSASVSATIIAESKEMASKMAKNINHILALIAKKRSESQQMAIGEPPASPSEPTGKIETANFSFYINKFAQTNTPEDVCKEIYKHAMSIIDDDYDTALKLIAIAESVEDE